ncbi:MAG: hypothetical protein KJ950_07610 [Proteobacteria bacterium]|nr:hypothetical protein [Pseudomonadota bacterium]MBU1687110.1 hypothetical protein [Pseudomonadota bacterium]
MKRIKKIVLLLGCTMLLVSFVGCEQKGPAEKAGEKLDTMSKKVGDKVQDSVDAAGKKIEETGEKLQR